MEKTFLPLWSAVDHPLQLLEWGDGWSKMVGQVHAPPHLLLSLPNQTSLGEAPRWDMLGHVVSHASPCLCLPPDQLLGLTPLQVLCC